MTNFEYFKDEIKAVGFNFAMNECGELVSCNSYIDCDDCRFNKNGFCTHHKIKWLYEEHKEQPKLTKNERKLCGLLRPYNYIARDKLGGVFVYAIKPSKNEETCIWDDKPHALFSVSPFTDCNFSFIKWEDDEPWSVVDLLKLEVEDNA